MARTGGRKPTLQPGLALRLVALVALVLLPAGAGSAQPFAVNGVAGFLWEWQFGGTATETASDEFTGSLAMKHVGLCTHDGPDERTSEIRLRLTGFRSATSRPAKAASEL